MGKCGEHCSTGRDHPNFIAIPHRANRIDYNPPFQIVFTKEWQKNADTVVEAFQKEKADK